MLAATMDEVTGGRFNLGLAAGAADFLAWVGIEDPRPVATMREAPAALQMPTAKMPIGPHPVTSTVAPGMSAVSAV